MNNDVPGRPPGIALPGNAGVAAPRSRLLPPRATPGPPRRAAAGSSSPTPIAGRTPAGWRRLPQRPKRPPPPLLAGPVRMIARPGRTPSRSTTWSAASPRRAMSRAAMPRPPISRCPPPSSAALGGFDAARFSGGDAEFCRRAGAPGHGRAGPGRGSRASLPAELGRDRQEGAAHQGRPDRRRPPAPPARLGVAHALPAVARQPRLSRRRRLAAALPLDAVALRWRWRWSWPPLGGQRPSEAATGPPDDAKVDFPSGGII